MGSRMANAPWLIVDLSCLIMAPSAASGSIHNPVFGSLLYVIKTRSCTRTVHEIFANMTSHPSLHSLTTDISEYAANPGAMCPNLAFVGSCGSASVQV